MPAVPRGPGAGRLYRGSAVFLAIYVAGSGLSFGVHLLLARTVGATAYGHFVYATSWLALLLLGSTLGLRPTVLRFAAAYRATAQWPLLRGLLGSATRWAFAASMAMVALAAAVIAATRPNGEDASTALLLVVAATPFMALAEVWCAAVRGLGAVARSQVPASLVQHLLLGGSFAALVAVTGTPPGAATAAAAFLLATLGTFGASRWLLRRLQLPLPSAGSASHARREWAGVAAGNFLIAACQAARAPLIAVMAGAQVEAQQLAYFVAASRLANVMALGLTGISGFAAPLISRYHALAQRAGLQRLAHLCARGALAVALAVALVLAFFGRELLALFGPGFASAFGVLLILALGEAAAAAVGPAGYFLTMTGRQAAATRIEAGSSVMSVVLAAALIPHHGITGAAIAVAAGSVARNLATAIAVWRHLHLRLAVL